MGHLYKVLSLISKYEQLDCDDVEKNEIELDIEKTNRYALVRNKVIQPLKSVNRLINRCLDYQRTHF